MSVVLATRDGARWVEEQVRSIAAQTRQVDQLLVVDDASQDGTPSLVRAAAAGGPLSGVLEVVERDVPLGVVRNFEDGLQRTTGDVVFFCDQDDVWEPQKVERVLAAFAERPGAQAVFTDATEIDASGRDTGRRLWQAAGLDDAALDVLRRDPLSQLLRGNCVTGATLALRRSCLDLVLPFPDSGYHDGWVALLLAAVGPGALVALPELLVRYRVHDSNLSGGLVPLGPVAGLLWYVERGALAEGIDVAQLAPAVARLQEHGLDADRLHRKLVFARRRRTLPPTLVRRSQVVASREMRHGYRTFTAGRLSAVLDTVWYDPAAGRPRPLPRALAGR